MTDIQGLSYTEEHEWVDLSDGVATVGITDHAADQLGDIVYVDIPAVGTVLVAGSVCGEIESTKSVSELFAPVSGTVTEVNDAVADDPALLNSDAFGAGWLFRVDVDGEPDGLIDRAAYVALTGGAA